MSQVYKTSLSDAFKAALIMSVFDDAREVVNSTNHIPGTSLHEFYEARERVIHELNWIEVDTTLRLGRCGREQTLA